MGNQKRKYIQRDRKTLAERKLRLKDVDLRVNPKSGRMVEHDIMCDSTFMMDNIHDIGRAIRKTYSFLPSKHPVYLFMDNARGHSKTEVKSEYKQILKEEFAINIVWQILNSP